MINEYGADGYYIKESPEFLPSRTYSLENTMKLIATIQKACERSRNLSFYWNKINIINETIQKDETITNAMKSVIKDRMNVVFSLISLEYRRSKYEKEKSDYKAELAFVSLWGLMNLLYELYFKKINYSRSIANSRSNLDLIKTVIPASIFNTLEKKHLELVKVNFNDKVFYVTDGLKMPKKTFVSISSGAGGKIKLHDLIEGKQNDASRIYLQISFLIMQLNLDEKKKEDLTISLNELNRFRNKLSIIHGVESEAKILKEAPKNNREILKKTKDLFNLLESIFTASKKKRSKDDMLSDLKKV